MYKSIRHNIKRNYVRRETPYQCTIKTHFMFNFQEVTLKPRTKCHYGPAIVAVRQYYLYLLHPTTASIFPHWSSPSIFHFNVQNWLTWPASQVSTHPSSLGKNFTVICEMRYLWAQMYIAIVTPISLPLKFQFDIRFTAPGKEIVDIVVV